MNDYRLIRVQKPAYSPAAIDNILSRWEHDSAPRGLTRYASDCADRSRGLRACAGASLRRTGRPPAGVGRTAPAVARHRGLDLWREAGPELRRHEHDGPGHVPDGVVRHSRSVRRYAGPTSLH